MHDLISVAKINSPFGIKGLAKVMSFMQNPEDIFKYQLYSEDKTPYKLTKFSANNKNVFAVQINDISDRTIIESLGKLTFYVEKKSLSLLDSEDEFYVKDLIGRTLHNAKYENIGSITNVYNFGAGDILEVKFNDDSVQMYPFLKLYFPQIDDKYVVFQDAELLTH